MRAASKSSMTLPISHAGRDIKWRALAAAGQWSPRAIPAPKKSSSPSKNLQHLKVMGSPRHFPSRWSSTKACLTLQSTQARTSSTLPFFTLLMRPCRKVSHHDQQRKTTDSSLRFTGHNGGLLSNRVLSYLRSPAISPLDCSTSSQLYIAGQWANPSTTLKLVEAVWLGTLLLTKRSEKPAFLTWTSRWSLFRTVLVMSLLPEILFPSLVVRIPPSAAATSSHRAVVCRALSPLSLWNSPRESYTECSEALSPVKSPALPLPTSFLLQGKKTEASSLSYGVSCQTEESLRDDVLYEHQILQLSLWQRRLHRSLQSSGTPCCGPDIRFWQLSRQVLFCSICSIRQSADSLLLPSASSVRCFWPRFQLLASTEWWRFKAAL